VRSVCVVILWLLASTGLRAADIGIKYLESGSAVVVIEGDLEHGDIETFRAKAEPLAASRATVEFRSNGGQLLAGIRIGTLIRAKKFVTVVPDGAQCASACALAWLGGSRRFLGQRSRVGFHSAYISKPAGPIESGAGNAILGAYLNQLGLSETAILYVTYAAPRSMQWMSLEEGAEYGIAVAPLPPAYSGKNANSNGVLTTEHPQGSLERRAIDFVRSVIERWSGPNADLLPFLDGLYTDKVMYYGNSTPRQTVLLTKRRFAEHWSQRSYDVRPASVSATCVAAKERCRVKGVMSWKFNDAKTTSSSHGVASFDYTIALGGGVPQIAAETSSISDRPSAASKSVPVGRTLQQLLAKLSPPPKAKAPRPKASIAN
jgi:hypothetical protein